MKIEISKITIHIEWWLVLMIAIAVTVVLYFLIIGDLEQAKEIIYPIMGGLAEKF